MQAMRAKHRWIIPVSACLLTLCLLSGALLYKKATMPVASGSSHFLPPNQWGFSSGTVLTKNFTHGALMRTEHYAFEKHGYYEIRYPVK